MPCPSRRDPALTPASPSKCACATSYTAWAGARGTPSSSTGTCRGSGAHSLLKASAQSFKLPAMCPHVQASMPYALAATSKAISRAMRLTLGVGLANLVVGVERVDAVEPGQVLRAEDGVDVPGGLAAVGGHLQRHLVKQSTPK